MRVLVMLVSLLLQVRAPIPNQPGFGSDPSSPPFGTPVVRTIAAILITVAVLAAVLWMAVRLVIGFL